MGKSPRERGFIPVVALILLGVFAIGIAYVGIKATVAPKQDELELQMSTVTSDTVDKQKSDTAKQEPLPPAAKAPSAPQSTKVPIENASAGNSEFDRHMKEMESFLAQASGEAKRCVEEVFGKYGGLPAMKRDGIIPPSLPSEIQACFTAGAA